MTFLLFAAAQAVAVVSMPLEVTPAIAPIPAADVIVLPQDTPVELMATAKVNTDDAVPGRIFKLRVHRPVEIGGRVVVPIGAPAFGQVVSATDAGGLGKSGRMIARLLHIRLGDAEVPLEGQTSAKGTGAGSAGIAVLFTGLMGLFHRGNNAKIKAGEILSGFVAADTPLDLSGPTVLPVATASQTASR